MVDRLEAQALAVSRGDPLQAVDFTGRSADAHAAHLERSRRGSPPAAWSLQPVDHAVRSVLMPSYTVPMCSNSEAIST